MTAVSVPTAVGAVRRRSGHFGVWRALVALPPMIGSFMLLLVLFATLGQWEGLVLLGWLTSAAVVLAPAGERVAVRLGYGFRSPTSAQAAALHPAWTAALARCQLRPGDVDLYVQRGREPNAYATGGRSVAVTTAVIDEFLARCLVADELQAMLCHELGHHATRATRLGMVSTWLAMPWRCASRLLIGMCLAGFGRQPRALLALVVTAAVVVVAVVQTTQQGQPAAAAFIGALGVLAMARPLTDAAINLRSEYAADRYTAQVGLGPQLASALQILPAPGPGRRLSWTQRALARYPDVHRRIAALHAPQPLGRPRR